MKRLPFISSVKNESNKLREYFTALDPGRHSRSRSLAMEDGPAKELFGSSFCCWHDGFGCNDGFRASGAMLLGPVYKKN
jgi:hypothetical protein